eukprot:759594-Pleurochrysis_carterae.AAC.1
MNPMLVSTRSASARLEQFDLDGLRAVVLTRSASVWPIPAGLRVRHGASGGQVTQQRGWQLSVWAAALRRWSRGKKKRLAWPREISSCRATVTGRTRLFLSLYLHCSDGVLDYNPFAPMALITAWQLCNHAHVPTPFRGGQVPHARSWRLHIGIHGSDLHHARQPGNLSYPSAGTCPIRPEWFNRQAESECSTGGQSQSGGSTNAGAGATNTFRELLYTSTWNSVLLRAHAY